MYNSFLNNSQIHRVNNNTTQPNLQFSTAVGSSMNNSQRVAAASCFYGYLDWYMNSPSKSEFKPPTTFLPGNGYRSPTALSHNFTNNFKQPEETSLDPNSHVQNANLIVIRKLEEDTRNLKAENTELKNLNEKILADLKELEVKENGVSEFTSEEILSRETEISELRSFLSKTETELSQTHERLRTTLETSTTREKELTQEINTKDEMLKDALKQFMRVERSLKNMKEKSKKANEEESEEQTKTPNSASEHISNLINFLEKVDILLEGTGSHYRELKTFQWKMANSNKIDISKIELNKFELQFDELFELEVSNQRKIENISLLDLETLLTQSLYSIQKLKSANFNLKSKLQCQTSEIESLKLQVYSKTQTSDNYLEAMIDINQSKDEKLNLQNTEITRLEVCIEELNNELDSLRKLSNGNMKFENNENSFEIEILKETILAKDSQLRASIAQIEANFIEISELKNEIENLTNIIEVQILKEKEQISSVDSLKCQIEVIEATCTSQHINRILNLQDEVSQLSKVCKQSEEEIKNLNDLQKNEESQISTLKSKIQKQESELKNTKKTIEQQEVQFSNLKVETEELKTKLKIKESKIEELLNDNCEFAELLSKAESNTLQNSFIESEIKSEIGNGNSRQASPRKQIDNSKLKKLEKKLKTLEFEFTKTSQMLISTRQASDATASCLSITTDKLETALKTIANQDNELNILKAENEELVWGHDEAREKLETQVSELQKSLESVHVINVKPERVEKPKKSSKQAKHISIQTSSTENANSNGHSNGNHSTPSLLLKNLQEVKNLVNWL